MRTGWVIRQLPDFHSHLIRLKAFDPDLENDLESEIARHVSTRKLAFLTG
jgi:hypothetical protein